MLTKQEIINGMCLTYRHNYGLLNSDEQKAIRAQMEQLFEHNFVPVLEEIYNDAAKYKSIPLVLDTAARAMGRE